MRTNSGDERTAKPAAFAVRLSTGVELEATTEVPLGVGEGDVGSALADKLRNFRRSPLPPVPVEDASLIPFPSQHEDVTVHLELDFAHRRPRTTNVALGRRTSSTLLEAGYSVLTSHGPVRGLSANDAVRVA